MRPDSIDIVPRRTLRQLRFARNYVGGTTPQFSSDGVLGSALGFLRSALKLLPSGRLPGQRGKCLILLSG